GTTPDKADEGKKPADPPKEVPGTKATATTPDKADEGKKPTDPPKAAPDPKAPGDTPAKDGKGKKPTEPPKDAPDPKPPGDTPDKADGDKKPAEPPKAAPDPKAPGDTPAKADGDKKPDEPQKAPDLRFVKISEIVPLPGTYVKDTPRKDYKDLIDSIKKSGLEKPVILRQGEKGEYQLVDGFHRCEALKQAGMLEVRAEVYEMPLTEASRYRKDHRDKPDLPIPGKLIPVRPAEPEKPADPPKEAEAPGGQDEEIPKDFTLPITKEGQAEIITTLKVDDIHPFEGHPFNVKDDKDMWDLVDSVKKFGVLEPVVVIPRQAGGYEMVSGHRRQRACQLAGIQTMPVIVRQLDRDEATISMVDANMKRENISPMEKAKAYSMKLEAMKRKAGRRSKAEVLSGEKPMRADEQLAQQTGESRANIQKITRLTKLEPELQQMVDDKKLPVHTAADISYLKKDEQKALVDAIKKEDKVPSGTQAAELKKASKDGKLTTEAIQKAVAPTKREETPVLKITLGEEDLRPYFPDARTTIPDVKRGVLEALDLRKKAIERQQAKAQAEKDGKGKGPGKKPPAPSR
ncbi:ParB/RepB/Spo0J family partition protein, partial [Colidextribacter sp. OB.20]|uniref:ParB/RepB/Spo0J family partition protein n=1 Tax=Colidextribacter sp. OB.20 TaxID=2304568 RepID=UPI00136D1FCA